MTTRSFANTAAVLGLAAMLAGFSEPRPWQEPAPVAQFNSSIDEYLALHRRIEPHVLPLRLTEHARETMDASNAMAAAIRTARPDATEGDIFGSGVAAYIRTRISDTLTERGYLPEEVVAATLEEADESAPLPVVNGRFPWGRGAIMWPCILDSLPPLPSELQYRIVGRDLVLVDVHADLVVDILRDAVR